MLGPVSSILAALVYLHSIQPACIASARLINFAGGDDNGNSVGLYQRCVDELGADFCDTFMTPGGALSGLVDLFDPILQPGDDGQDDQEGNQKRPVEDVGANSTNDGSGMMPSIVVSGNETAMPSPPVGCSPRRYCNPKGCKLLPERSRSRASDSWSDLFLGHVPGD